MIGGEVMRSVQFIHAADLHLDSPFSGLKHLPKELFKRVQESTFNAFDRLISHALENKIDFLLISGDLFDGEDRSLKAQIKLQKQMVRLQDAGIEVFFLHGNHDHLSGSWTSIDMPNNVHIFSEQVEKKHFQTINGTNVYLYGFSYGKRHVYEKKIKDYQKEEGADFHIGMLHGYCTGGQTVHQPYAPFSVQDLLDKKMDYWALGHIHQRQMLHEEPYIIYPGNIQGRNKKETGTKGCTFVSMNEFETNVQFLETADIIWEELFYSAKEIEDFNQLYTTCREKIEEVRKKNQGTFLSLQIQDTQGLSNDVLKKVENGELLEILQDDEEMMDNFVWVHEISIHENDITYENDFLTQEISTALMELKEEQALVDAISPLYSHVYGNRFLDSISNEDKMDLLIEAEKMVYSKIKS